MPLRRVHKHQRADYDYSCSDQKNTSLPGLSRKERLSFGRGRTTSALSFALRWFYPIFCCSSFSIKVQDLMIKPVSVIVSGVAESSFEVVQVTFGLCGRPLLWNSWCLWNRDSLSSKRSWRSKNKLRLFSWSFPRLRWSAECWSANGLRWRRHGFYSHAGCVLGLQLCKCLASC